MPSNSPATDVDDNGYLQPQPSDAYIASLQANTLTSSAALAEPSSAAASKQRHQTQDEPNYQSLQLNSDNIPNELYQHLRKELM